MHNVVASFGTRCKCQGCELVVRAQVSMFSRVVLSRGHLGKGLGQVPMKTPILTREIGVGRRPYVPASRCSAPFCMFSCQLDSNSSVCVCGDTTDSAMCSYPQCRSCSCARGQTIHMKDSKRQPLGCLQDGVQGTIPFLGFIFSVILS